MKTWQSRIAASAVMFLVLGSCARQQHEPIAKYQLTGEIQSLDRQSRVAVIRHEDIKDEKGKIWMKAMTMEFPVRDPAEFARLRLGMHIRATVFQRGSDMTYWIADIQSTKPN